MKGIYEGQYHHEKKNGHGKMIFENGNIYEGNWFDDEMSGKGKMIFKNDEDEDEEEFYFYEGQWKKNKLNGHGKMIYKNGNIYEGEWKNSFPNGIGKMIYNNGNIYEGEWNTDLIEKGIICQYELFDGHGKMIYDNGSIYKGQWSMGLFDGEGKFTHIDNDNNKQIYEGSWTADTRYATTEMTYYKDSLRFTIEFYKEKFNKSYKSLDIDPKLSNFLGIPNGIKMTRKSVEILFHDYIKDKNLQNPKNKKEIIPDDNIIKLFNLKKDDLLTYFNIVEYLKPLFIVKERPLNMPYGFAEPFYIDPKLSNFLGSPIGDKFARIDVTKLICNYVKDNNLQNPNNRREIIPDEKLTKLFNLKKDDQLTYFNLPKYMAPLFIKQGSNKPTKSAVSTKSTLPTNYSVDSSNCSSNNNYNEINKESNIDNVSYNKIVKENEQESYKKFDIENNYNKSSENIESYNSDSENSENNNSESDNSDSDYD